MIELLIAFGAGLISFLSPCVLPLIPGYISYISGSSINELIDKNNSYINFKEKIENNIKNNSPRYGIVRVEGFN